MIDIESYVFDTVYNAVIAEFPSARVDAGYVEKSALGHEYGEEVAAEPVRESPRNLRDMLAARKVLAVQLRAAAPGGVRIDDLEAGVRHAGA